MDSVDELLEEQRAATQESEWESALAPLFVAVIRSYELLSILCDSEKGRGVLQSDELRNFACWQISDCRNGAAWSWQHLEEATPAAVAMLFVAQAFFVASHSDASSSADVFPRREQLHDLVHESDAYEWLTGQGVDMPDWLAEEAD